MGADGWEGNLSIHIIFLDCLAIVVCFIREKQTIPKYTCQDTNNHKGIPVSGVLANI